MPDTTMTRPPAENARQTRCQVAVVWIDWYAYHISRFRGLARNRELAGQVAGIEIVGGVGVHAGLKFRTPIPRDLPVRTLFPDRSWEEAKGFEAARAVWKALDEIDPALVLVPGYYTIPGLAAAFWGRWNGRRTVLMTESTERDHRRSRWKEAAKGLLLRALFDWAIAGGSAHRRYLLRLGFWPDRIARFYDVVDNDFFAERTGVIRREGRAAGYGLPEGYFLYVGRLAEEKNVAGLVESYLEYRDGGGTRALVLVGDGPQRRALEGLAAESAYGRDIHFAGLRDSAELPYYYAFAACFVLPSSREPWGLVVNEAMAAGLPVLVSKRCGCAEDLVVEGENGLLFDPSEPIQLTASLAAMGSLDEERLREMGAESRRIVSRFSPAAWGGEVARILRA